MGMMTRLPVTGNSSPYFDLSGLKGFAGKAQLYGLVACYYLGVILQLSSASTRLSSLTLGANLGVNLPTDQQTNLYQQVAYES